MPQILHPSKKPYGPKSAATRYGSSLLPCALYVLTRFFSGQSGLVKTPTSHVPKPAQVSAIPPVTQAAPVVAKIAEHKPIDTHDMPNEVAYIFDTSERARPRLAAVASVQGGDTWGVIEWRQDQTSVIERMSLAQLRDMGLVAEVHSYGVKLVYKGRSLLITAWPLDLVGAPSANSDGTDRNGASRAAVASVERGAGWKENAIAKAYTPPEHVKGPERSDWRPSH